VFHDYKRWVIVYTVMMLVNRKVNVAIIERTESLPIPHTACPLVHPFASDTQNQTSIPAMIYCQYGAATTSMVDAGKIIL
jgi:hypothetical protein